MWRETNVAGIYMSPAVVYLAAAALVWLVVRAGFEGLKLDRYVWNPPLMEAGLFVCILGLLVSLL